jgi:hypothetical protein
MNIYQRINEVRKQVDYLKKDKKVESYWAVTHDMVTAELRRYLIEYGIVIITRQVSGKTYDSGKATSKGTPIVRYEGLYEFDLVNMDEPEDRAIARVEGHAEDHGDKAPGKALSYAKKALMLKTFEIETGESDESRIDSRPIPITELDLITLRELCEAKGFYKEDADTKLKSLAERVYGLKKIEDLPNKYLDDAKNRLTTMAAKNDKPVA